MTDGSSASNFDNYIAELHEHLDQLHQAPDVDDQCSVLVGDLAEAYSEQPSPMKTGRSIVLRTRRLTEDRLFSDVSLGVIRWSTEHVEFSSSRVFENRGNARRKKRTLRATPL